MLARVDRRPSANPLSNRAHAVGLARIRPNEAVAARSADQPLTVSSGPSPESLLASRRSCPAMARSFSTWAAITPRDGRLLRFGGGLFARSAI